MCSPPARNSGRRAIGPSSPCSSIPTVASRSRICSARLMHKLPVSVLVVVHTAELEVLLLERSSQPGYWQSVTGSLDRPDEPLEGAAARGVAEGTGIDPS